MYYGKLVCITSCVNASCIASPLKMMQQFHENFMKQCGIEVNFNDLGEKNEAFIKRDVHPSDAIGLMFCVLGKNRTSTKIMSNLSSKMLKII